MEKHATFAERLKDALNLRNMTKADLSRLTGISKSSLTHYEKGDWEGKQDAVYKIARAVKVPESWLMGFGADMSFEDVQRSNAAYLLRSEVEKNPDLPSGKRLYFLMDNSNIPMRELTKFSGLSEEAILDWINRNIVPPNPMAIEMVKNFYLLTTTDLFPKAEIHPGSQKQPPAAGELSEDEVILLQAYRALPEHEKQNVLSLLRLAAGQAQGDQGVPG